MFWTAPLVFWMVFYFRLFAFKVFDGFYYLSYLFHILISFLSLCFSKCGHWAEWLLSEVEVSKCRCLPFTTCRLPFRTLMSFDDPLTRLDFTFAIDRSYISLLSELLTMITQTFFSKKSPLTLVISVLLSSVFGAIHQVTYGNDR